MNIGIDARFYGLENAGLGRYTIHFLNELAQVDSKNQYTIFLRKKYFHSLKFPSTWKKVLADYSHYGILEQVLFPKLIKKEKLDVMHFLHFNVPYSYRGPYIVTIHDLLMHRQKGKEATTLWYPLYLIKRAGYSAIFKNAVQKSKSIVVPTQFVKEDVCDYYHLDPQKVTVVYEGVEQKAFSRKLRRTAVTKYNLPENYFIYTGNAYPHKNLKRAMEAVLLLNKSTDKKAALVIVSARNIFVKRLEQTMKDIRARDSVKLLGFVPDIDLTQLYRNSLGFVYPSLMEGFGLPGLEAMTAGTIVLASDIPVFHEVYKDNVVYFNPHDFSSIAEAMKSVVELDPETREKIVKRGQQFVKRYSWAKMAREIVALYESSLGV